MDEAHISDIVLSVQGANHKLRLPEPLVVGDMVVGRFSFTDFINRLTTLKFNLNIFKLLCVDFFKLKNQLLIRHISVLEEDDFSLKVAVFDFANLYQGDRAKTRFVFFELLEWCRTRDDVPELGQSILVDIARAWKITLIHLVLDLQ